MPLARWPGMWHSTVQADGSGLALALGSGSVVGTSAGTCHSRSTRWPEGTTTRTPPSVGRDADDGRRTRRRPVERRLRGLPRVLDRAVADDDLVDVEPAVDDVEHHRLAGDEVQDRRHERVVLGDEVDLAGASEVPPTGIGVTATGSGSHAASTRRQQQDERADEARGTGHARSLRRAPDAVPGTRRRFP